MPCPCTTIAGVSEKKLHSTTRAEALKKTVICSLGTYSYTKGVHASRTVACVGSALFILVNPSVGTAFNEMYSQEGTTSGIGLRRGERTGIPLRHRVQLFLCLGPVDFTNQSIHSVTKNICLNRESIVSLDYFMHPRSYLFFKKL